MSIARNYTCQTCGKPFVSVIKRENGHIPRFCSPKCIVPRVKKTCENCKKEYEVIPYRKESSRWCNKKCMENFYKSVKPTDSHVYNRKDWHDARKQALERDDYTCQVCGKKEPEASLHVNHIMPYRIVQSHNVMNLVTLCSSCHAHMDYLVRDLLNLHPIRSQFLELLGEMWMINVKKSNNYAKDSDPLSNIKSCEQFGVKGSMGIMVRMSDKWSRLTQLMGGKQDLVGESIEDTLLDMANYCLLLVCQLRSEREKNA